MFDLQGNVIEPGARVASAHRRGDVAEMRIGTVIELYASERKILVEWSLSSAPGGYIPQRPTSVYTSRVVVLR